MQTAHPQEQNMNPTGTHEIITGWVLGFCSLLLAWIHNYVAPMFAHAIPMDIVHTVGGIELIKNLLDILVKIGQLVLVSSGAYFAIKGGIKKVSKD